MEYKKIELSDMLFQSSSFDNIDDMLEMKSNVLESIEQVKAGTNDIDDIIINHHCDIQDGVFTFAMQTFQKFSLI
jgi:hypothetical protein